MVAEAWCSGGGDEDSAGCDCCGEERKGERAAMGACEGEEERKGGRAGDRMGRTMKKKMKEIFGEKKMKDDDKRRACGWMLG